MLTYINMIVKSLLRYTFRPAGTLGDDVLSVYRHFALIGLMSVLHIFYRHIVPTGLKNRKSDVSYPDNSLILKILIRTIIQHAQWTSVDQCFGRQQRLACPSA